MRRDQGRTARLGVRLRPLIRPIQRIAAFGSLPAVSLLSTLVLLPLISARFGQPGWSSVLLGQSIGAAASVVCALAWPVEGADLVSRAGPVERHLLYRVSVRQTATALGCAGPVVAAICLAAGPEMPLVCVLSALAVSLNALSPAWYFVGRSRPSQLLVAEGGPRVAVYLAAIPMVLFLPLWTYPVALIVGMLATLGITRYYVDREARPVHSARTDGAESLPAPSGGRFPMLAILARTSDAGSSYLAPPLVALVAAPAYPLFAAIDKLSQTVLNGMITITRGLTAWIAEADEPGARRRLLGAVAVAAFLAAISLAVLTLATPYLLHYLFAGTVDPSGSGALLAAVIIAGTFLAKTLSLVLLVPQGQVRAAYWTLIAGACLGLPAIGLAARAYGSLGALAAAGALPWMQVGLQLAVGLRKRRITSGAAGTRPRRAQ